MIIAGYIVFLIFCMAAEDSKMTMEQKKMLLMVFVVVGALVTGQRDIYFWPDTPGYFAAFTYNTPEIKDYVYGSNPPDYQDKGFFFLSVLIKTFTTDWVVYSTIIGFLGLWTLYKGIEKFSLFPLFAFALYIGRFLFGRQFIQIRAGVAIAIVFWGMQYVVKQDFKRYLLVVFLASLLHSSAWIAVPAYFLNRINLKSIHMYWGIVIAYILAAFFTPTIRTFVSESAEDLNMSMSYTTADYGYKSTGKGLANPMVYYQILILFLFTYYEKRLSKLTPYYITLRNGYFYCTVWLTTLCSYSVLSARGSTILATYEILMIPLFIKIFHKKNKVIAYIMIIALSTFWFYMNLTKRG